MQKLAGIYDTASKKWAKLAYLHADASGRSCVDGHQCGLIFHRAGDDLPVDGGLALVIPPDLPDIERRFVSIAGGECMVWCEDGVHVVNAGFVSVSSDIRVLRKMRAAVLTVGEGASAAGALIAQMTSAIGSEIVAQKIVAPDRSTVASTLRAWADELAPQLILTNGGIGVTQDDRVPEAISEAADISLPGFGEAMRASIRDRAGAMSTRPSAAVIGRTLVVSLPGRPIDARRCFEAICGSLRSTAAALSGWEDEIDA